MGDLGGPKSEIDPTFAMKIMQLEARVYEKESRLARIRLDIQDLENLSIKQKKFELQQVELERIKLTNELNKLKGESNG
jgi:SMC interacting uncharacterized protein involved in chromosome segregation